MDESFDSHAMSLIEYGFRCELERFILILTEQFILAPAASTVRAIIMF